MPSPDPLPDAFIGHGNPMNAIEHNRYTETWRAFGASVPRPRGVLVISAHWFIGSTAVTAMAHPRTIHDFYGFPDELFAFAYPASGAPDLAQEIADVVRPHWVGLDHDSWGLDHGAWSVLSHMFPDADVPVVQLSINALEPLDYHFDVGSRLAPLRHRGVLIVASGNVVHNLRLIDGSRAAEGFDWARRFNEAAVEVMTEKPGDVLTLQDHEDFALAVPTADHFIPLLYLAGLADASAHRAHVLVDGYTMGSLSMAAYGLGTRRPVVTDETGAAPSLPDPSIVAPEDTNT